MPIGVLCLHHFNLEKQAANLPRATIMQLSN